MPRLLKICVASTLLTGALSDSVTQYLGLAPDSGIVSWMQATFPSNYTATSADEVSVSTVDETVDQIGAWQNLDLGGMPLLTVKTSGDILYTQLNTGIAPLGPSSDGYYPGGCCVDVFRAFNINDNGNYTEWDMLDIIYNNYENVTDTDVNTDTPYAYGNHVFDMTTFDNSPVAMIDVTYHEPGLNYGEVDSVMFFNTITGTVIPTADGDAFFSFFEKVGTTSTTASDSIYKIYYASGDDLPEQYHMNGITRFQSMDGTWILAVTFRASAECVLIKCPYEYTSGNGGGTILQRFGTPTNHRFGYSTSDGSINVVHNTFHTAYPDSDRETMTIFVNEQEGYTNSRIFEFDVKLTPEPTTSYDDTVFDTDYLSGTVSYSTDMWGGARPVGQGVWLVAFDMFTVVDQTSNELDLPGKKFTLGAKVQKSVTGDDDDIPPPPPDDTAPPPPGDDDKSPPGDDNHDDDGAPVNTYDAFTYIVAN